MDEKPMLTECLRCGLTQEMTTREAIEHDDKCRKARKGKRS